MKETEIELDGKKIKVVTKLSEKEVEDNNLKKLLDDTIDLTGAIEVPKDDNK